MVSLAEMLQPSPDAPNPSLEDLEPEERDALVSAATWYANYHARIISEKADDPSAQAVAQRERFHSLVHALRKMGVRLPPPEILAAPMDRAA